MPSTHELDWSFADIERDPQELVDAGFRPVWTSEGGYPGPLPADIAEWIDPELGARARLIGPMSSLFWLAGLDDLVAAIDDPTYTMSDEVINIPQDASIRGMVPRLWEDGKIPTAIYNSYFDLPRSPILALPIRQESIPAAVTSSVTSHALQELFPMCRQQDFPQQARSMRNSFNRNIARLTQNIERDFTRHLGDNLLFRGLSRKALFSSMLFFVPVISSANSDNEFGPGIYTTPSLEHALQYTASQGAVLVFQNPNFQNLNVSELDGDDWRFVTAYCLGHLASNARERLPSGWGNMDVMRGSISTAGRGRGAARIPGPDTQVVAVSYVSCAALAASLRMIIWFE
jgi:hypothetical protein